LPTYDLYQVPILVDKAMIGPVSNETAAGFWSYTHEDDMLDGGNILRLSRLIMEEYSLLSGEPLNLFVDRNDLAWGEEWRERIDSSLAETTFFIPVITPRYFKRPECRRELLEFAAKAEALGTEELLLPILYIETEGLSAESPDEVVALVARTQYVDWRKNRLLEPNSREYRVAVNALAQRLLDVARKVAEIQLKQELASDPEDDGIDGITDIVGQIETFLPDWLDVVMGEKSVSAQILAVWDQYRQQGAKLRRRRAQPSALFSAQVRMAREMLPLAQRTQNDSQVYLARSVELDPLVSALTRLVAEHPESFPLATPVREAIDEAMEEVRRADSYVMERSVQNELRKMGHLGRVFQQTNSAFTARYRNVDEGNEIVRRWDAELIDPMRRESKESSETVDKLEHIDTEES
jgi:hypothetical protein